MNVKALLKQVPTNYYLALVLGVGAIGAYQGWAYQMRERGKLELRIAQHEQTNADLRHQADSLAKVQKPQTAAAVKWRTKWDTLKAGLDTQWLKPDSVPVPVDVVRYIVASADSAVRSCTLALQTCDQRVAIATKGWDNARGEIALLKKSMPSKAKPWMYGAAGVGIGVLARSLVK